MIRKTLRVADLTHQALGQDGLILAKFFCVFMKRDGGKVLEMRKKKTQGHYSALLTKQV